jgi:hypothetical protein
MPELILLFKTHDWIVRFHTEASILNRSGKEDEHHVLSSGASLSRSSVCHEKKIAQSFSSTFPYFVKIMKSFNVGGSRILVSCSIL